MNLDPRIKNAVVIIFLGIFCLTALVTIFGIAGVAGVNIPEGYLSKLFYALILEVVAGVLVFYRFAISTEVRTQLYTWIISYYPNVHEKWLNLQENDIQKNVREFLQKKWELQQKENLSEEQLEFAIPKLLKGAKCQEHILHYLAFEKAKGQQGKGQIALVFSGDGSVQGIAKFEMPGAPEIPISVTEGSLMQKGKKLSLTFSQPDRVVAIGDDAFEYRGYFFVIEFQKENQQNIFRGELGFRDLSSNDNIIIGETMLRPYIV